MPHGELVTEDMIKLAKGNTVTGRVIELMTKSSDRDVFFRVKLSLLQDDIVNHDRFLERDLDEAFVID